MRIGDSGRCSIWVAALIGAVALSGCQTGSSGQGVKVVTVEKPFELTHKGGDPYDDCSSKRVRRVVELANRARENKGLHPVHCAPDLTRVARKHARDMCDKKYASHIGKDGRSPADRVEDAGIDYMAVGENIAVGQPTSEEAHKGWMGSRKHRANIRHEKFSRLGVGFVDCGDQPHWVQVFAN